MTRPAVSIITPVRATRPEHIAWLDEAIASVAKQTSGNWEMIIVDDGSPLGEDVAVLADKWKGQKHTHWFAGEESGTSACRNLAAQMATSELLLPLDADDKLATIAVEKFLTAWKKRGDAGIIYSGVVMFGQDWSRVKLAPGYDFNTLLQSLFMFVGCLHSKADWERVGGWRTDMELGLEDWEYWIALGEINVCGKPVREPLYWYRRQTMGRLERLKADPHLYHRAYQRMRDLHRDAYNGRLNVCGCGGGIGSLPGRTNRPAILNMSKDREPLVYMGRRQDEFWVTGSMTRQKYLIQGRGEFLVDGKGEAGVDPRDVDAFLKLNKGIDFRRIARPRIVEDDAEPLADSEAWEPEIMEAAEDGE